MKGKIVFRLFLFLILFLVGGTFVFVYFRYFSKAAPIKADIKINYMHVIGPVPDRWKAFAQGGEEKGVRMLGNVVPQLAQLYPRYVRLDHIYDFYDVVSRDSQDKLTFNFDKLDQTVCDIYHTGAKPFFSLGYMPPAMSADGSLISVPKSWDEWSLLVQKTIEHYSGNNTRLCGQITGFWTTDLYYEVWNEPDLETFGSWSKYGGAKDYRQLYYYSALAASRATAVNHFLLGGPATTAPYKEWFTQVLDYLAKNHIRIDFLSWHHYSKNANDFVADMEKVNDWLSPPQYQQYARLPRVVSEWGFDSDPNQTVDTPTGAAYTLASIRNFLNENYELAFLFEVKDGPTPRWGILSQNGDKKARYGALELLNLLQGQQIKVDGEGTFVKALASRSPSLGINIILVNYDLDGKNSEDVPVTFSALTNGTYTITTTYLGNPDTKQTTITVQNGTYQTSIIMPPNSIVSLQLSQ